MGITVGKQIARVRVKVCGITRPQDALMAAQLGADAIGLVFFPGSPRAVNIDRAQQIIAGLPPFVSTVGLFVNASAAEVDTVLENVNLDILQFHGDEAPEQCSCFPRPFIKAIRMQDNVNLKAMAGKYDVACALLLDAYVKDTYGGSGTSFDWSIIPDDVPKPLILAGGLDAGNVAAAVKQVRPYGVDVSGGVELEKGIKDAGKVEQFIREVRNADNW
jgi:phosphoribosylanthranilate isomerase